MLDEAIFTAGDLMTRDVAAGAIVGMISEGDLLRWHEGYSERQARWLDLLADGFEVSSAFLEELQKEHRKV
jgi:hypothetical protein